MPGNPCGYIVGIRSESRAIDRGELHKLKTEPVPDDELNRSKAQLKGSLMLSLESSTSRMSNLARQEMYFDRFYDLDELIAHRGRDRRRFDESWPMNSSKLNQLR